MMASFTKLINDEKPVLIDFSAEWCGPCKTLAPILKQLADQHRENPKIIKIDIDKNPAIANAYQVQSVPTLMLFKNGKSLWRQSGVVPLTYLNKILSDNLK